MYLEGVIGAYRAGVLQASFIVEPIELALNRLPQAAHAAIVVSLSRTQSFCRILQGFASIVLLAFLPEPLEFNSTNMYTEE